MKLEVHSTLTNRSSLSMWLRFRWRWLSLWQRMNSSYFFPLYSFVPIHWNQESLRKRQRQQSNGITLINFTVTKKFLIMFNRIDSVLTSKQLCRNEDRIERLSRFVVYSNHFTFIVQTDNRESRAREVSMVAGSTNMEFRAFIQTKNELKLTSCPVESWIRQKLSMQQSEYLTKRMKMSKFDMMTIDFHFNIQINNRFWYLLVIRWDVIQAERKKME